MDVSERAVQDGPVSGRANAARRSAVGAAAAILLALCTGTAGAQDAGLPESSKPREYMSLQDRMKLLQKKQTATASHNPSANYRTTNTQPGFNSQVGRVNPVTDPYANYRREMPAVGHPVQTGADSSDRHGFQPTSERGTLSPRVNGSGIRSVSYAENDARFAFPPETAAGTGSAGPIGGWQTLDTSSTRGAPAIYEPTAGPEQVVSHSEAPLSRPGEIPDGRQPSGPASHILLPQIPDLNENLSSWGRLKLRLAAGQPMTLQNTFTTTTWLFSSPNDVGLFDVYSQATFLVPSAPGFSFTPSVQVYFFDGPTRTDLPSRVYSLRWEFRQQYPLHERLAVDMAISPGIYTDFEQGNSDAVRVLGRVLFSYLWSERAQVLFGFLYLDRDDVNVLPAGGVIYTPSDDMRFEFVFPRPKIAYRTSQTTAHSRWLYLAGEFGGDAWAVERSNGTTDNLAYRDLRLIVGVEQRYANGRSLMLEAGYVFGREIEFTSNVGDFDPGSTGMLRAAIVY